MRMLSRTKMPPHEWQLLLPEIGMTAPIIGGLYDVQYQFDRLIRKNLALAEKYGWPKPGDTEGQLNFIDDQNARRCAAHGWVNFVDFGGDSAGAFVPAQKKTWLGNVVGSTETALAAYANMFGPEGPEARDVAERRAAVCVQCPQNEPVVKWRDKFIEKTAQEIIVLLGALKDLKVETSLDDKLGKCKACNCPMKAKVHSRLHVLIEKMPPEIWPALQQENPVCWMKAEAGR